MRRKSLGFTLIELVITIAVVGVLATVAYVTMDSSLGSYRLGNAEFKVIGVMRYAQQLAMTNNDWYGVSFLVDPNNQYTVYQTDGSTDTPLSDPANPAQNMVADVAAEFPGVVISAVNIAGGDKVEFSPTGEPFDDRSGTALAATGTVTLTHDAVNRVIDILPVTGRTESTGGSP